MLAYKFREAKCQPSSEDIRYINTRSLNNLQLNLLFYDSLLIGLHNGDLGKATRKVEPQTFTSFSHSCLAFIEIVNHLTQNCGFDYVLTSRLQNDPIEYHFGLYRMISGAHYHVTYTQIIENERRIKISSVLKMFSKKQESDYVSLKALIDLYSSSPNELSDFHF